MMRFNRPGFVACWAVALTFATLVIGCQRGTGSTSRNSMLALSPRLQPLFESTKKICFGRFLMQVPVTATVVYGPAEVETPIMYFRDRADKLDEHVAARLVEIENERQLLLKYDIPRLPLFGKLMDGIKPGQKIVFGSKNKAGYTAYSFVPVGKDLFVQHVNSVPPDEDIVGTFNSVAGQLQARTEDDIPAMPGMCIEGGFVPWEGTYERVTIGIRLKEFPDVHFSVDVHKNLDYLIESSSPKLLREQAKEAAEAAGLGAIFARIKILRQQTRQLGTWKGEEIATRTPAYKDDTEAHEFRFHSVGAVDDPFHPELDIRLDSGLMHNQKARIKPSITDEEALELWDKLITTIRLRQPSDATPAPSHRVPIASLLRTGEICPQTGWWESSESNIDGGKHLIKAGQTMPYAVAVVGSGLWQKLIGKRPRRQTSTTWKLVDYDHEHETPQTSHGADDSVTIPEAPNPSIVSAANPRLS